MDETLRLIAEQHKEWIKIINSFGEYDFAEDLVQEMYILIWKYGSEEKVIRNGKVSRGYIFFTLRNLYYQYFFFKPHYITSATNTFNCLKYIFCKIDI